MSRTTLFYTLNNEPIKQGINQSINQSHATVLLPLEHQPDEPPDPLRTALHHHQIETLYLCAEQHCSRIIHSVGYSMGTSEVRLIIWNRGNEWNKQ